MSVRVQNVSKSFATTLAVDDVSFALQDNSFVSIVGPSGCGKSTLLRMASGLIRPSRGTIVVRDSPVDGPVRDVGMVFQSPVLLPWRTTLNNILFVAEMGGQKAARHRDRALELMALAGLGGFEHNYPHELSGGMQQRCNLARALTVDPKILIMDEPFAALDAQTREIMQAELLRIWRESGKTVLFITHQINEAIYLADRVIVFGARPGKVKEMIKIDLPRPRDLSIKRDPKFLQYEDRLWSLIEEEVKKTMLQDQVVRNINN